KTTASVARRAPTTPITYPLPSPRRRPRLAMSADRVSAPRAAPRTTVDPGAPARVVEPRRACATIVATVIASMCPVLPSATPAVMALRVRRLDRASDVGSRVTVAIACGLLLIGVLG